MTTRDEHEGLRVHGKHRPRHEIRILLSRASWLKAVTKDPRELDLKPVLVKHVSRQTGRPYWQREWLVSRGAKPIGTIYDWKGKPAFRPAEIVRWIDAPREGKPGGADRSIGETAR